MANSMMRARAALEAVASRFSASCRPTRSGAYLELDGRRIAAQVATIRKAIVARDGWKNPRLRFDGVALRLMRDLATALREAVPRDRTVVITVTAPIRKSSKTAAALVNEIGRRLARRRGPANMNAEFYGNRVQARLVKDVSKRAPKVISFVHNPDSDPEVLFGVTQALLQKIGSLASWGASRRAAGACWLVMIDETGLANAATYRHVCDQLALATRFEKILLVLTAGGVEPLIG